MLYMPLKDLKQTMQQKITGLIAAPYTPMHGDGSINLAQISNQATLLKKEGVAGAFICGTTGEGASLTIEERMKIAEAWMKVVGDDFTLIVHVGHNSIGEARKLAKHARSIDAHAVAALAPSFFKPATIPDLVTVCATIAEAADSLPFFYYHIPSMTGVNLPMPAFLSAASKEIPNLAGVKFSYSDLMQFRQCATMDNRRFTMFFGSDEMLLGALAMGAEGAVGSTYNYAAPNYVKMISAFHDGDLGIAQKHASNAVDLVQVLFKYGVLQGGKAIMGMRGVDCGPVRLPLKQLSEAQKTALYEDVSRLDIFAKEHLTPPA